MRRTSKRRITPSPETTNHPTPPSHPAGGTPDRPGLARTSPGLALRAAVVTGRAAAVLGPFLGFCASQECARDEARGVPHEEDCPYRADRPEPAAAPSAPRKPAKARPRLTREQAARVRELIEDEGQTRAAAVAWVLAFEPAGEQVAS
jgi:hypothetical protein